MNEILKRVTSRKFIAFAAATVGLFFGKVDATVWAGIAAAYMASNVIQKALIKKGGNEC